jgi:dihydrofolate reductase
MIAIVVATDKNRVIGEGNKIPWHIRSDFIRLANLTRSRTVILGRKTYDSMVWYYNRSGRRMPGSCYIIVTRNATYTPERDNARVAHSIPEAVELAKSFGDDHIMVIGGGSIFTAMLPYADTIYLTEVQAEVDGDSYFPPLDMSEWREVSREHHAKNEQDDHNTEVIVLERR